MEAVSHWFMGLGYDLAGFAVGPRSSAGSLVELAELVGFQGGWLQGWGSRIYCWASGGWD